MTRPEEHEYPGYYEPFIGLTKTADIVQELEKEGHNIVKFLLTIPEEKGDYRYHPDKWSLKEVLAHIIDTERIFNYRALCFSRGEINPLPGFDENMYAENCGAAARTLNSLTEEFLCVRRSTVELYKNLSPAMMLKKGTANEKQISVRAIAHITCGHGLHHLQMIRERYL